MSRFLVFVLLFSFTVNCIAQDSIFKKTYNIKRTSTPPKIDGVLDDDVWQNADVATDFVQFRPAIGNTLPDYQKTTVKMTYDDKAIYVAAYLRDKPEDIMRQFTSRDNFGINDFFIIAINPNNDGQNDTYFVVFPNGGQADAIANPSIGEDYSWNAVWQNATKVVADGWIVEVKIPYRALRFTNQEEPTWGIQFHRQFRKTRKQYTWNPFDPTKGYIGLYAGEMKGLRDIQPPTRLILYPFASTVINSFDGVTTDEYNFGMDVKYGITENFTLDATLVPDFSQAGFDNLQLNLGPFEQTFSEQRQFFTEGVDLFNKGSLFFSRRIGNAPSGSVDLADNEELVNSPDKVKLINAVKVSGRTKDGLGIGFFNAITEVTKATVRNNDTGEFRQEVVEPLTNYNILVVDQQFNQNSSISLINTNVTRDGSGFRDANVTGLVADLVNKKNTMSIATRLRMSNRNLPTGTETGLNSFFAIRKINGKFRYSFDHSFSNTKYDINDLGLNFRNNFNNFGIDASYQIFEPTEKLNNFRINTWVNYNRLYDPNVFTGTNFGVNVFAVSKKSLMAFGADASFAPGKQYDYFEPRDFENRRFFIRENEFYAGGFISTDYNKTFALDMNANFATFFEDDQGFTRYRVRLEPRVRVNDKCILVYSSSLNVENNRRGYANDSNNLEGEIIFGQRDQIELVNSISANYSFNALHALNLTFRNYWTTVDYDDTPYFLQENGRVVQSPNTFEELSLGNSNINFSTWNLDLSYTWQFGPGSFLTALYRNQIFNQSDASKATYFDSLNRLFDEPIDHTLSIRLVYFIDFNNVKGLFQRKKRMTNINS
ncbi:carbohydrate binding protein with CBM9 domain [Kordia periserrulae]|uniref:Carbohydrate binding protein with CBM9 domain n=1 Tax=Kordia periserrulae TaxID=701523 RepID=A0A2T6C3X9_9FLAO|nr:DUF5916 domain-containing protein [Kordia periserrulae]PTX62977.1 carbohydrate binding protein with CBM9 domain [Kordia periserrulae]